jgi:hypothetical protein
VACHYTSQYFQYASQERCRISDTCSVCHVESAKQALNFSVLQVAEEHNFLEENM